MKDTTLKSLSEVVTKESYTDQSIDCSLDLIWKYNDFLKQPLQLWMFIPCNDKGEPLKKPVLYWHYLKHGFVGDNQNEECKEYQKAKDRVLFKIKSYEKKDWVIWIVFQDVTIKYYIEYESFWIRTEELNSIFELVGKVQLTDKQDELLNL